MKYKTIRAMAHNWSHSFMSGMNYVDGDHICYDLRGLALELPDQRIVISWIPVRPEELLLLTPGTRKSIEYYRDALPKFLHSNDIQQSSLIELRTEVFSTKDRGVCIQAYALDDRGKEYVIDVLGYLKMAAMVR